MDLSKHLSKDRAGLIGVVVVTALCAALVAAASANAAKLSEWAAPLPGAPPGKTSQLDFILKSKKNKKTKKFNPVAIKKLAVTFLYLNDCSYGQSARTSFTWGQLKASDSGVPDEIPVSGRRFSFSTTAGDGSETSTFTFSGRVPRNGPPTGTLRYKTTYPALVSPPYDPGPDPENPAPVPPSKSVQVTCDSGTLSWTGIRIQS